MLTKLKKTLNLLFTLISFLTKSLKVKTIFFFPFYHTGGAERVHLDIVKSLGKKKSIIIFTAHSSNNHFLTEFKEYAYCYDFKPFLRNVYYNKAINFTFNLIGYFNKVSIFGCNSSYYYDVLKYFNQKVKKIDLLHAFTLPDIGGMEVYSLPFVKLLDKRIVINKKTKNDFVILYKENNIDLELTNRIDVIYNGVEISPTFLRNYDNHKVLSCVYCGRIAIEKRVDLIVEIGKKNGQNVNLSIYGHKEIEVDGIEKFYIKNIESKEEMNLIYQSSDILLITSYREGFPMVVMEAMANGVVCICTDVGGIKEHIINGENGFLVSNELDKKEIIEKFYLIISELNSNRNLLRTISKNALEYSKNNFSLNTFSSSYKKILLNDKE